MDTLTSSPIRTPLRFSRQFSEPLTVDIPVRFGRQLSNPEDRYDISLETPPTSNGKPYKFAPLSTPSPSAGADGLRVDVEIERLRRLSEDFSKKDLLLLNGHLSPRSKSLSPPPRTVPLLTKYKPVFDTNGYNGINNNNNHYYNNNNNNNKFAVNHNNNYSLSNGFNHSPGSSPLANGVIEHQPGCKFYYKRAKSPLRERSSSLSPSAPKGTPSDPFLPFTFPDLPSYKMPAQRRFSEDVNFRRPLATLHEDEVMARRRFSEDVRKKSVDTSGVMEDMYKHHRRLSEAGVRRLSDASLVLTEDTDSFIIGDRVWVGGTKPGVISYIGETQFAPGEWAGVTLDEAIGKNDGSVAGVRYFQCEAKKGVFSRLTRLSRNQLTDYDIELLSSRRSSIAGSDSPKTNGTPASSMASGPTSSASSARKTTPSSTSAHTKPASTVSSRTTATPAPTPRKTSSTAPASTTTDAKIGDHVVITSGTSVRHGVLLFVGKADFADGVWAGVELDEPTGKNDGSVAGKKYFECKEKYGLFAPIGRVSKYGAGSGAARRTSAPQTPRATMHRSSSRESLGASSVASSTTSSVRGTRRPTSRPVTSSVPNTKALQEALSEKTQHVDQLMRERDIERSEVARMAAQADEATRAAQDMKLQLDKLQIESEERLHDSGERIRALQREKEEVLSRLEDKQKDLDDLSFQLEEESISKADLEKMEQTVLSRSTTDEEVIKKLQKEMEEAKRKLQDRGKVEENKAFEMEEMEINLRASVEEFQVKVMDLEKEKEELENTLSKNSDELKSIQANNEILKNNISEREQKIKLLETSRESDQDQCVRKSTEISEKDSKIKEFQLLLQGKSGECEDSLQKLKETSKDVERGRKENEALQKELKDIQEQLKSGASESSVLVGEVSQFKEELRSVSTKLEESTEKISTLEAHKCKLTMELKNSNTTVSDNTTKLSELTEAVKQKEEHLQNVSEKLQRAETSMKNELESWSAEKKKNEAVMTTQEKEHKGKLQKLVEKITALEHNITEKTSEGDRAARQLKTVESQTKSLEDEREKLKEQVSTLLTSSSDSSKQLEVLNHHLQDKGKELENVQVKLRETESLLSLEKSARAEETVAINKVQESGKESHKQELEKLKKKIQDMEENLTAKTKESASAQKQYKVEQEEIIKKKDLEAYELQEQLMMKEAELLDAESKMKRLEVQVTEMTSSSADTQGTMEKTLASVRQEKDQLVKEKEEIQRSKKEVEEKLSGVDKEILKLRMEKEENLLLVTQRDQQVADMKAEVGQLMATFNAHREDLQRQLVEATKDKEVMAEFQQTFKSELDRLNGLQEKLTATEEERITLLKQKDQLEEEIHRLKSIEEEKLIIVKERDKLTEDVQTLKTLQSQNTTLNREKDELEEEIKKVSESQKIEKDQHLSEKSRLEEEIRTLKKSEEERNRLGGDVERLEAELKKMTQIQENNHTLSSELKKGKEERDEMAYSFKALEEKLATKTHLEEDNVRLTSELKAAHKEKNKIMIDIQRLEAEAASGVENLDEVKERLENTMKTMQEEKRVIVEEKSRLEAEVRELKQVEEDKKHLESRNLALVQNLEELKLSQEGRIGDLETEKFNLVEEVVSLQDQVSGLNTQMVEVNKRSAEAEAESEKMGILRAKVDLLETEKRRMESKIVDLRVEVKSTEISHNDSDGFLKQMIEEKDQLEGQVNFLNSLIVDMQRKNDELKTRIEIFEMGNVSDDTKANMNGINLSGVHAVAPRMFCDICDCFDVHETEDCPKQATSDSPPPSHHQGQRGTVRSYCDTCEVFGHETGECNEDETF